MRVRLSDGTTLDVKGSIPSKATVKRTKGSLKRWRKPPSLPVVGSTNTVAASYVDYEIDPTSGEVIRTSIPRSLATTIDPRKHTFTWDLGGSASTGYIGGRGV